MVKKTLVIDTIKQTTMIKSKHNLTVLYVLSISINVVTVFFKVVVIICLLIKQLLFLDLGERHQQAHSL